MKAAAINKFGKPEVFEVIHLPLPDIQNDQVLIKNFASSINPIDFKSRGGKHKYILGSKFPIILGYDFAGEVIKTGNSATEFKEGDRVFGRSNVTYGGTYAQYCVSSETTMTLIPDSLTFDQAAGIPLAGLTALQALRDKCNIKKDQNVLIIGATGGVGHFAVQLVNYYKARSYAVCSSNHNHFIQKLKPFSHIDYNKENYLSAQHEYDIIFDAAGILNYIKCRSMLKKNGIYITTLPRPKLLVHKLVSLFSSKKVKTLLMKARQKDLEFICDLIKQNQFTPHIDRKYNLSELAEAHTYASQGHTEGKIIITIDHDEP